MQIRFEAFRERRCIIAGNDVALAALTAGAA
jgi:hypothetical protein